MKKITFTPIWHESPEWITGFIPAKNKLPHWYKSMNLYMNQDGKAGLGENHEGPNTTVKGCAPFLDALVSGYIYELSFDVEMRKTDQGINIRWRTPDHVVNMHDKRQHPGLPKPQNGKFDDVFKWYNPFSIKTPKGYSTLFTHPLNRHDLPFRTFSGVVDTDFYPNATQFPFQVLDFKEPFIVLEKGTPLAQVIPFKRENWEISRNDLNLSNSQKANYELFSKIVRSYKSQWWQKKTYN